MDEEKSFVIPETVTVHGVELTLHDIDIKPDGYMDYGWKADVTYKPSISKPHGGGELNLRFNSEHQFIKLLRVAGGKQNE